MEIKSGFVTIIGLPNVGKSTLMNKLVGEKLSIITPKPQTTRKRILGILSAANYQIIFLDTPGILKPNYLLQQKMVDYVFNSAAFTDIILILVDIDNDKDGLKTLENESVQKILSDKKTKKILTLNKIDISNENAIRAFTEKFEKENLFDFIIPISALENFNLDKLLNIIIELLPVHPKYFPDDQITDESERFFVSEIIREKIFEMYKEEIPYCTEVLIAEFKERATNKDFISAEIVVEKDSQKSILIGRGGDKIKKLGSISRKAIEEFLQREVFLGLRVKVRTKWRSNDSTLKRFGYITDND
ncbi:MAG: GTPase Era [Ignavibacteriales bacterium]|nr:GTPase Era [Ignavibacteriales bacterium]